MTDPAQTSHSLTIETVGRRHYLRGNTYAMREQLRAVGAHWDPEQRAWWTGSRETAETLAATPAATPQTTTTQQERSDKPRDGEDSHVAGRATYHGRQYYVAGRVVRGRTHWDDRCEAVRTADGSRILLYFRDGSKQFWAAAADVQMTATYERPKTLAGLRRYAARARENGGVHPDACPNCGQTSCSAAYGRGGLCDED